MSISLQKIKLWASRWSLLAAFALNANSAAAANTSTNATKNQLSGKLTVTGASTIAPLALEIAKRFEGLHPGVRIDVQTGGSSRGIADARQGLSDIGMVSRSLKADESDLLARPIALDGVSVILHKSNPINSLSDQDIIKIYKGEVTNWREVGGPDAKITVVNKAEGRSTLELFINHFKLKNSEIKAHIIIGDNEQGIKTVAGNPHAIGYVSIGSAEYSASIGVAVKLLPLAGIAATTDNVKNGSYPLARPLNFATKTEPQGLAKAYIEFAQSTAVADLVKELYFVPIVKK